MEFPPSKNSITQQSMEALSRACARMEQKLAEATSIVEQYRSKVSEARSRMNQLVEQTKKMREALFKAEKSAMIERTEKEMAIAFLEDATHENQLLKEQLHQSKRLAEQARHRVLSYRKEIAAKSEELAKLNGRFEALDWSDNDTRLPSETKQDQEKAGELEQKLSELTTAIENVARERGDLKTHRTALQNKDQEIKKTAIQLAQISPSNPARRLVESYLTLLNEQREQIESAD